MKKVIFTIYLLSFMILIVACKKKNPLENQQNNQPTVISPTETITKPTPTTIPAVEALKVDDYYPFLPNTNDVFEGKGNEYASYQTHIDFIDNNKNQMQIRTNNGGSETVQVIGHSNGEVSVLFTKNECYYRDNFIKEENFSKTPEILLKEPLVVGTKWKLPNGNLRFISNTTAKVDTPLGNYSAIEVTTEEKDGLSLRYYAKGVGLIKQVYKSNNLEVTSTLSDRKTNVPFVQRVDFYYLDVDENIHTEQRKLSFLTNDITRIKMQDAMKEVINKKYIPLMSLNTKIDTMYLGKDKIVYVDFSKEFISEMNLGSGFEDMVLQCIANTLGRYYTAEEVLLTVDKKPYASGHIILDKGETLKVNIE